MKNSVAWARGEGEGEGVLTERRTVPSLVLIQTRHILSFSTNKKMRGGMFGVGEIFTNWFKDKDNAATCSKIFYEKFDDGNAKFESYLKKDRQLSPKLT